MRLVGRFFWGYGAFENNFSWSISALELDVLPLRPTSGSKGALLSQFPPWRPSPKLLGDTANGKAVESIVVVGRINAVGAAEDEAVGGVVARAWSRRPVVTVATGEAEQDGGSLVDVTAPNAIERSIGDIIGCRSTA